ncbi:MAG TPA: peptidoglycan-associated lipoprotein Pal [Syntrophaceae bacterium]|nr:peptidoglycan-associated lipoprotein Pal [Syntrophaceae bacterium]
MGIFLSSIFFAISCAKKVVRKPAPEISVTQEEVKRLEEEREARRRAMIEEEVLREEGKPIGRYVGDWETQKKDFEMEDIHFEFDSAVLTEDAQSILRKKAAWLLDNQSVEVLIEGHCDERGTAEYNLALGERRATSAKSFLTSLGVDANRLATISYGEEKPLDPGHNEEAWAKNRRVHFVIAK